MSDHIVGPFTFYDTNNNNRIDTSDRVSYQLKGQTLQDHVKDGELCTKLSEDTKSQCRDDLEGVFQQLELSYSKSKPSTWGRNFRKIKDFTGVPMVLDSVNKISQLVQQDQFLKAANEIEGILEWGQGTGLPAEKITQREIQRIEEAVFKKAKQAAAQGNGAEADRWIHEGEKISRLLGKVFDEKRAGQILNQFPSYEKQFRLSRQAEPLARQGQLSQVEALIKQMEHGAAQDKITVTQRTQSLTNRAQAYQKVRQELSQGLPPQGAQEPLRGNGSYEDRVFNAYRNAESIADSNGIINDEDGGVAVLLKNFHLAKSDQESQYVQGLLKGFKGPNQFTDDFSDNFDYHLVMAMDHLEKAYPISKDKTFRSKESKLMGLARKAAGRLAEVSSQKAAQCARAGDTDCSEKYNSNAKHFRFIRNKSDIFARFTDGL